MHIVETESTESAAVPVEEDEEVVLVDGEVGQRERDELPRDTEALDIVDSDKWPRFAVPEICVLRWRGPVEGDVSDLFLGHWIREIFEELLDVVASIADSPLWVLTTVVVMDLALDEGRRVAKSA